MVACFEQKTIAIQRPCFRPETVATVGNAQLGGKRDNDNKQHLNQDEQGYKSEQDDKREIPALGNNI